MSALIEGGVSINTVGSSANTKVDIAVETLAAIAEAEDGGRTPPRRPASSPPATRLAARAAFLPLEQSTATALFEHYVAAPPTSA